MRESEEILSADRNTDRNFKVRRNCSPANGRKPKLVTVRGKKVKKADSKKVSRGHEMTPAKTATYKTSVKRPRHNSVVRKVIQLQNMYKIQLELCIMSIYTVEHHSKLFRLS